ncbi:MAG TPA: DUF4870 domain-containing protein [Pyrinomonadaceae bacterium]|nr:DUF4870 domain-containing protein [Pyrinomonadaceae bacterium]
MQNPPPVQTAKSSTGLDENVAALLAYVATWVSGLIFFLIEKESRFVRFHAMQAILLGASAAVIFIVLWILSIISFFISAAISDVLGGLVGVIITLLFAAVGIGFFIAFVLCLIKAYQSQYFKLPVIGNFAEKFSMPK